VPKEHAITGKRMRIAVEFELGDIPVRGEPVELQL